MSRTVMVIEDEPELYELIQDVLVMEGYEVTALGRPEELEEQLATVHPDLFLIDIMLPHTSGVEIGQRLRAQGYADTPLIGMSASRYMAHVASESGVFTEVIERPFEIDDLLERIERYLGDASDDQTG